MFGDTRSSNKPKTSDGRLDVAEVGANKQVVEACRAALGAVVLIHGVLPNTQNLRDRVCRRFV